MKFRKSKRQFQGETRVRKRSRHDRIIKLREEKSKNLMLKMFVKNKIFYFKSKFEFNYKKM